MSSIVPSDPNRNPLTFNFHGHDVRIVPNEDGEPLFVAGDICKALDLPNVSTALAGLREDEKGISKVYTPGGSQNAAVVTEQGMYRLVFRSNKNEAEEFRLWIFRDVLPAIRKTGIYAPNLTPMQILRQMFNALDMQEHRLDEHAERITSLESRVQTDVEYFTVMGYCRKCGILPPSLNQAQSIGQRAAHLSRVRGFGIGKTSDPRFGTVNCYHISILEELFKQEK